MNVKAPTVRLISAMGKTHGYEPIASNALPRIHLNTNPMHQNPTT